MDDGTAYFVRAIIYKRKYLFYENKPPKTIIIKD